MIDLDQPAVRDAVSCDPATFVSGPAPVCIDEFQKAPVVLDAIKAELNRNRAPGRFVITGSTRFDALPTAAQALTGRIHIVDVLPFSQGETTAHWRTHDGQEAGVVIERVDGSVVALVVQRWSAAVTSVIDAQVFD
ncbi:AAA family ATPase [Candidatus Poriferisodalis sp.]|uniref:AAA family ATPase n=1 Tax=Candidatus Poriferisodalis sp. TaxID=3101277 RepID=UPI003D12E8C0